MRLRVLMDASLDGIAIINQNHRVIEANKRFAEMLGYTPDEVLGLHTWDWEVNMTESEIRANFSDLSKTKTTFETRHRRKDGTVYDAEVTACGAKLGDESMVLTITRDITDMEEKLKRSLSLVAAALESTADGILVVNRKGRIILWNNRFADLWNIPREVLSSKDDATLLKFVFSQLDDPEGFLREFNALYADPEKSDFGVLKFKDGRYFERFSIPQRVDDNIVGRVWSFRDITKRRQAEEKLKISEARYRLLFKIAPAGIWEVDFCTGKFINVNDAVCDYSGYSKAELLSMKALDVLTRESQEKFITRLAQIMNGENVPNSVDYEIVKKDGSIAWFNISNKYIYEGEKIVRSTVVARDITEIKKSNIALKNKSERLMEVNAALNVLIENMESKKVDFQEQVTANIQHLVLPYLGKIKKRTSDITNKALVDIIESNLDKLTENFTRQLSSSLYGLTATEIKVANLIKLGNTTKEIAATLNISDKTVESHRERIRKKLGINGKKINLRTHLLSVH